MTSSLARDHGDHPPTHATQDAPMPSPDVEVRSSQYPEPNEQHLRLLYTENAAFARTFLEWRHKVIMIYFLSTGGMLAAAKWFWESRTLHDATALPLIVGAVFCFALASMDTVNTQILHRCWETGKAIEERIGCVPMPMYTFMASRLRPKRFEVRYWRVLRFLFIGSATAFSFLAWVVWPS